MVPDASSELPELTADSTEEEREQYARQTFVDRDWVDGRLQSDKRLARWYAAIRVKVEGKPWVVLVVDSASPQVIDSRKLSGALRLLLPGLSPFLGSKAHV